MSTKVGQMQAQRWERGEHKGGTEVNTKVGQRWAQWWDRGDSKDQQWYGGRPGQNGDGVFESHQFIRQTSVQSSLGHDLLVETGNDFMLNSLHTAINAQFTHFRLKYC